MIYLNDFDFSHSTRLFWSKLVLWSWVNYCIFSFWNHHWLDQIFFNGSNSETKYLHSHGPRNVKHILIRKSFKKYINEIINWSRSSKYQSLDLFHAWFGFQVQWAFNYSHIFFYLYRFRDTSQNFDASSKRYVITNPPVDFHLLPTDQVS